MANCPKCGVGFIKKNKSKVFKCKRCGVLPRMYHMYTIQMRHQKLINTDPQRRCYDGCNYSEELVWSKWDVLESIRNKDEGEQRLIFWRELNDYAISQRGESARSEFRLVPIGR